MARLVERIERALLVFADRHALQLTRRDVRWLAGVAADAAQHVDLPEHVQAIGETLTPRHLMLLRMVANGLSDQVISRRTAKAVPVIAREIATIVHRLGAVDRPHAVAVAIARGLIRPEQIRVPAVQMYAKPGPRSAA